MMAVHDLLDEARRHGVTIAVDGDRMKMRAAAPPPPELVQRLRLHKTAIIRALTSPPADPCRCAWCGKAETPGAVVVPFGGRASGHTWLHHGCWAAWAAEQARCGAAAYAAWLEAAEVAEDAP